MGKLAYLLLLSLLMLVAACSNKDKNANGKSNMALQDSVDAHGLQRMQSSKAEVDIDFKGKKYHSLVVRTPDEMLPHVTNEMGDIYLDNKIVLRLMRDGAVVVDKIFTKQDFAAITDADFLQKSVLEGIVFDKTTSQGMVYAASICYPQTDLYIPFSITITGDGKINLQKVEILEDVYAEDTIH